MMDSELDPFIATIRRRLAARGKSGPSESLPILEVAATEPNPDPRPNRPDPRPAAVLIPLYKDGGEWHVLLTERTHSVAEHRGQVAFPGGKVDPEDVDRVATALRETHEEIGVLPGDVSVLGTMPDFATITDYHVTPVVGVIPWPYDLKLSSFELSQVFGVPLSWIADPAHLRVEMWTHPVRGHNMPVYFYDFGDHTIWGATARMLHAFAALATAP